METSDLEAAIVRAFVLRGKRRRLAESLANPKRRGDALHSLHHFRHLDPRFVVPIPNSEQRPPRIAQLLRARGAPAECYLISSDAELDGQRLPLLEALERVVGQGMGTLVSCIPGELGYFEGEEPNHRLILERTAL